MDRRLFIPDVIWRYPGGGRPLEPLDRAKDPAGWEQAVEADAPVVVQIDDGTPGKWGTPFPTCSSTAPWLMARMLDALRLEPGMSVLEIGTGTGYSAGYADRVTVLTGDGELGVPERAPFDRVLATAAAHTIPHAWVEQTRDGGVIVLPYAGPHHRGGLVVLDVHQGEARGHVVGEAAFMPLRGQRLRQDELQAIGTADTGPDGRGDPGRATTHGLHPPDG